MEKEVFRMIVPAAEGRTFEIKKGQYLTVKDVEGNQICDFIAFDKHDYTRKLSVSHTRLMLENNFFKKGDTLYTWHEEPMFTMIEDTYGVHDMTFPSCDDACYLAKGIEGHPSCRTNFVNAMKPFGIEEWMLPDPFNIFMNSPDMKLFPNKSKAGDYVKFKCEMDALVGVTSCAYDLDGLNGGKPTPIEIIITEE